MAPSSATPSRVPPSVPRPPEIAVPPTTTAAITFISRPTPAFVCTSMNWMEVRRAARPTRPPMKTNTPNTTPRGRMPTRRAASGSEPVA